MSFQGAPTRSTLSVTCKSCHRPVPAGVASIPDNPIAVRCARCGEQRQFRPSEVYEGRVPFQLIEGGKRSVRPVNPSRSGRRLD